MNAINRTSDASKSTSNVKPINPMNEWRKGQTQSALNAIKLGKEPDMTPFQTAPRNDNGNDRFVQAFSDYSIEHTITDYLLKPVNTAGLEDAFDRTEFALGKKVDALRTLLTEMQRKFPNGAGVSPEMVKDKNDLVTTIKEIKVKVDGIKGRLDEIDADQEARKKLAAMLNAILFERHAVKEAAQVAAVETEKVLTEALGEEVTKEILTPSIRKSKSTIHVPARPRNEIKAQGFEGLKDALTHRAVADVKERMVKKSEAVALAGGSEESFNEVVELAIAAGEEEIVTLSDKQAILLVRKVGNARRFFVKQVVAA